MTLFKQTYVSDDDDVTLIIQKWNIFSKVDEKKNHMFTGIKNNQCDLQFGSFKTRDRVCDRKGRSISDVR